MDSMCDTVGIFDNEKNVTDGEKVQVLSSMKYLEVKN